MLCHETLPNVRLDTVQVRQPKTVQNAAGAEAKGGRHRLLGAVQARTGAQHEAGETELGFAVRAVANKKEVERADELVDAHTAATEKPARSVYKNQTGLSTYKKHSFYLRDFSEAHPGVHELLELV